MLNPFINLISNVIFLINLALMVWIVLGLLVHFDVVNRRHPLVARLNETLNRLFEPVLRPIRRLLSRVIPESVGLDLSPIAFLLILHFVKDALYHWFYQL